jgi:tetratricopeptide (TPR) repeat protein
MRRTAWLVAWALVGSLGPGCDRAVPAIDPALHRGVRVALEKARAAVVAAPASAAAWGRYGMLLDAHDCRAEARDCYRRARRLAPRDVAWCHLLAVGLEPDDPEAAIALYMEALALEPRAAAPRLRLADVLVARDDVPAAIAMLDFEPADAAAAAHRASILAVCHERAGRIAAACAAAAEAVRAAPGHRGVYELQARLLFRAGDAVGAEAALTEARRLPAEATGWPDAFLDAMRRLRVDPHRTADLALSAARGRPAAAVAVLADLAEEHPDDWTFVADLARCQIESGAPLAAVRAATDALRRHPRAGELRAIRGVAHLVLEDWAAAAADLEAAVALRPGDASAWSDLAFAQQQLGMAAAVDSLRRALSLAPLVADDHVRLAELLLDQGDVVGARASVGELAALVPRHPALGPLETAIERAEREKGQRDGE